MALRYYANAPATTLDESCSSVATSITVVSTAGLPISYPYTLILGRGTATEEAVSVTAAGGTVLTVTRGIDNTTAFAHAQGVTVEHGITAQDIREANTHVNSTDGVHGVVGDVVGTTDVQHLTDKTADTPLTSDDSTAIATTEFVKAALLAANPVDSIVFNTSGDNPSTYLGGTWIAWGSGRVPVGVDAGQAEFNTVEETGGSKTNSLTVTEMPSHNHGGATGAISADHTHSGTTGGQSNTHVHAQNVSAAVGGPGVRFDYNGDGASSSFPQGIYTDAASADHTHSFTTGGVSSNHTHSISSQGSGGAFNILQPYITCYMFKRTA